MPSQRPRAQFEPIPPNLSLSRLVEAYEHFDFCPRIPFEVIQENGVDNFEKLVKKHVIAEGKPLVVDGLHTALDPWTFSAKWLKDNVGDKVENARDLNQKDFIPLTIRHYLNNINAVTNQHFRSRDSQNTRPPQRIYLKDIDCPEVWQQKLSEVIPPFLYYLNESTGEYGGPGARAIKNPTVAGRRLGKGIATAGDLMSTLPPEMRAENLMCYIGHEGTYTPSHREMCATMGHNIMVEASGDFDEDGKPERPGSSIWFMTEAKDRSTVAEYWLSKLGHDIEVETHFAQINSWKLAPFKVYIVDQRPGDFILIPPLAPHQVWNRGTRTMKVAWNRTTVETLEMAVSEALPKARIVCRDEQYKNKAMIYFALTKYSELLQDAKSQADKLPPDAGHALLYKGKVRNLLRDFRRLFNLFKDILLSEMFSPDGTGEKCDYLPFESNVTCAYCRGNIFNRFLSCNNCKDALGHSDDEPYDVCMECYAMGRSCYCISGHQWVEQFKWKELTTKYDAWRKQMIDLVGDTDRSVPFSLMEERRRMTQKTLAQVVREQLKCRPFRDPSKSKEDEEGEPSDEEVIVDDDGRVIKRVKKHSKTWHKNHARCHVCKSHHEIWKMAKCTRCERRWCYGSLFRGHDDMPLDVMRDPNWECAHCQNVCFAGNCRQDPRQKPYQPKGTLLGHDTKRVADARSVEVLVDFSVSNLNWIREKEGEDESTQMRRAREEAERAKEAAAIDDEDDVDAEHQPDASGLYAHEEGLLDPELRSESDLARRLTEFNQSIPPPPAPMYNGASERPDGYMPAQTDGYPLAPADDDSHLYVDPSELHGSYSMYTDEENLRPFVQKGRQPYNHGKRKRGGDDDDTEITMEKPKKRRNNEPGAAELLASQQAGSQATRQYQNMKERKALEKAKREGRFFSVSAALRGKKKVVRLKVAPHRLAAIVTRRSSPASNTAAQPESSSNEGPDLLRSDVQPAAQPKAAKPGPGRRRKKDPEDAEVEDDDDDSDASVIPARKDTNGGPRRISAYLQARHKNQDLPDELPDDFRDGRKRPRPSDSDPSRPKHPTPARKNGKFHAPKPSPKAPTGKPRGRPKKVAQPSITEAEKNRLAKLDALQDLVDDTGGNTDEDTEAAIAASIRALAANALATNGQTEVRKSIFDRKTGPGGRKIKIVSAKRVST